MPTPCRRRIVRRAVMALAVVALLVSGYVASWGALFWWMGRNLHSRPGVFRTGGNFNDVFAPLILYSQSDMPGSKLLYDFSQWCFWQGEGYAVRQNEAATRE